MKLHIALGQMDVALGQPDVNFAHVQDLAVKAHEIGADVLVLPELWPTGYDLERADQYASSLDEGLFTVVSQLAHTYNLHIIGSMLSLIGAGQFGNTAVFFNNQGQRIGHYSKAHLFRLMDEDQFLTAGDRLTLVQTQWGTMGLSICYDLRFPELYRTYALNGAQLVFVPAEWPHPRLAHWRTLLRARAIENQMFVVACNRVGESKGTHFFGHSAIIDPWGETVVEGDETAELLTAVIDLNVVAEVRQKIPVFADRRPKLYFPG
ncbi:MAG: carbon-nitrogen family hydrolase [Candidatus Promineifilaceae bacterium]